MKLPKDGHAYNFDKTKKQILFPKKIKILQ